MRQVELQTGKFYYVLYAAKNELRELDFIVIENSYLIYTVNM